MRPIRLPASLWPFPPIAIVGRPWWVAQRKPDGTPIYLRTDGLHYEGLAGGSPESAMAALARKDMHQPVPTPPPAEGQVWVWIEGDRIIKRMILGSVIGITDQGIEINDIVWSIGGVPEKVWPPPGGQLLDGPFAPWSGGDGIALADVLGEG